MKGKRFARMRAISYLLLSFMLMSLIPPVAWAENSNGNGVIDDLVGEMQQVYAYMDAEDMDDIDVTRSELEQFVSQYVYEYDNSTVSEEVYLQWHVEVLNPLYEPLPEQTVDAFGGVEQTKEALVDFISELSKIQYSTDSEELRQTLLDFRDHSTDTFQTLFGTDVAMSDLYQLLKDTRTELINQIDPVTGVLLATDDDDELVERMGELTKGAMQAAVHGNPLKGKLAAIGWSTDLLLDQQRVLASIVDDNNRAQLAFAKAGVRSEAFVFYGFDGVDPHTAIAIDEILDVQFDDVYSINFELDIMGNIATNRVFWHSDNEDVASFPETSPGQNVLEINAPGEATIYALRDYREDTPPSYAGFERDWVYRFTLKVDMDAVAIQGEVENLPADTEAWIEIVNTVTEEFHYADTEEGSFELYLKDGTYEVREVWVDDIVYDFSGQVFEVLAGQAQEVNLSNIAVDADGFLTITLPGINVEGEVINLPADTEAWLEIVDLGTDEGTYTFTEEGSFELYLKDGTYEVREVWVDDAVYDFSGQEFEIAEGKPQERTHDNVAVDADGFLTITLPTANVEGYIENFPEEEEEGWIYLSHQETGASRWILTDEQGAFEVYLADGTYDNIMVYAGAERYEFYGASFEVDEGSLSSAEEPLYLEDGKLAIPLPIANVSGKVENLPADEEAWIYFENEEGRENWVFTAEDGTFDIYLPTGTYSMIEVYVGADYYDFTDATFTVNEDELLSEATGDLSIVDGKLIIPLDQSYEVTGKIVDGAYALVNIVDPQGRSYHTSADEEGAFSINLPDGEYTLESVEVDWDTFYIEEDFTVDGEALDLGDISPFNVQGKVFEDEEKTRPLADAEVIINKKDNADDYYVFTRQDGSFVTSLPEGTYEVSSVYSRGQQVDFTEQNTFVVDEDREMVEHRDNGELLGFSITDGWLNVVLPPKNVSGTVYRGDEPFGDVTIYFHTKESPRTRLYAWADADADGKYSVDLTPGKTWVIEGLATDDDWIVYSDEKVIAEGETYVWDIELISTNLLGEVDLGDISLTGAWISMGPVLAEGEPEPADYYDRYRWGRIQADGSIEMTLPAGNYEVLGVFTSQQWFDGRDLQVDVTEGPDVEVGDFTTVDTPGDETEISVTLKQLNVAGTVVDFSGNPLGDAWLEIGPAGAAYAERWWVLAGADGKFQLSLDEEQAYTIHGVDADGTWTTINYTFTPKDDLSVEAELYQLTVRLPGDTLQGTLYDADQNSLPWASIGITAQGVEVDAENFWSQTRWISTDSNGEFSAQLPEGDYYYSIISTSQRWIELSDTADYQFSITPAQLDAGEVKEKDLSVPAPNVEGTAVDKSVDPEETLGNAWIELKPKEAGYDDWDQYRWIYTDQDGDFAINLPAGEYEVTGIYHNGIWTNLKQYFEAPVDDLEIAIPAPNLSGTVSELGDVNDAWVAFVAEDDDEWSDIHWAYVDEVVGGSGDYSINLPADEKYYVAFVSTAREWVSFEKETFTVTVNEGGVADPGTLNISLQEDDVSGTVTIDGDPLEEGAMIGFKRGDRPTRWVRTDEQGDYNVRLRPGDYKVNYIVYQGKWYKGDDDWEIDVDADGTTDDKTIFDIKTD